MIDTCDEDESASGISLLHLCFCCLFTTVRQEVQLDRARGRPNHRQQLLLPSLAFQKVYLFSLRMMSLEVTLSGRHLGVVKEIKLREDKSSKPEGRVFFAYLEVFLYPGGEQS